MWWRDRLNDLTSWAARRTIAPRSLVGASVLLALCSATWLSGRGFTDAAWGAIAAGGWYAMLQVARALAAYTAGEGASQDDASIRRVIQRAIAPDGGTDWLVLPAMAWDDDVRPSRQEPDEGLTALPRSADLAWQVSDGGLVVGRRSGAAGPEPAEGTWAIRETGPAEVPRSEVPRSESHGFGWLAGIGAVAAECAIYGGIAASRPGRGQWLLAVVTIAGAALAETAATCRSGSPALPGDPAEAPGRIRGFWRLTDLLAAPSVGWRVLIAIVLFAAEGPRLAMFAVLVIEVISLCWIIAVSSFGWPTARFARPAGRAALLQSRDDGLAARWAGGLVHGGLLPLPPVLAGLFATTVMVAFVWRSLPGFAAMTPPAVMMLASAGSRHPHDGRNDWLVPVLLATAQYVYLASLGFAASVPGAFVFAACAMLAVWQACLAPGGPPIAVSGIGWEGRMFGLGLAAIFGFGVFGYVGLAVLLGAMISWNIATAH